MKPQQDSAFKDVLTQYGPMLGRISAAYERDPELQKDLLQEMALAIWRALPKFEERSSLKTFVARIAHYRGASHVAKEVRHSNTNSLETDALPDMAAPEIEIGAKLDQGKLLQAVRRLPLKLSQVATLALEGFEAREVAEVLGISANNASVRLARAKDILRKELENGQ